MKLIKTKIAVVLLLLVLVACKGEVKPQEATEITPAPNPIKVYTKDDISVKAYKYDGLEYFLNRKDNDTTYVVNFWATWCVPCVKELPYFEQLNTNYKDEKVKVLLVSLDMRKMIDSKLIPFLEEKKLESEVIVMTDPDSNSWIPKIDSTWSGAIPATIIYNKNKRKFYERSFTYDELNAELMAVK
ncbi:TlpA disulfide reductase family protein [Flavobacterium litorale]|uniref:TlpA family protein disulfide reductase n=1 Tax=Flavobacterium litorale TaxID=2856519 RepID=A0ABX8V5Y2_9FLAO|nr:TlpA disulfide reductase family protein [Flavobacterium litorale]QYJ67538.1 TlpA family protein disulfide reductase [Flavobacterium litorale]